MKRTAIYYREMGDNVVIFSIENAATMQEICDNIGAEATHKYRHDGPYYHRVRCTNRVNVFTDQGGHYILRPGDILHKETLGHIVQTMKVAVDRLQHIRKEHELSKIKKVII